MNNLNNVVDSFQQCSEAFVLARKKVSGWINRFKGFAVQEYGRE